MRIAVLTYRASFGAFAAVTRGIAQGLTAAGVEVDVLYLDGPDVAAIAHEYPAGVRLFRIGGRSRTCWPAVARYLRRHRPDGLISLGWILNPAAVVAVAVARTRTPLALNEASLLSYKTGVEHRHQLRLRVLGALARLLYPRADVVTGVSQPVVDDLENVIGLDPREVRLRVVPNAVDGQEIRRRSLLPDGGVVTATPEAPVFVNVARHARQKNLPLLLRAFRTYRASGGRGRLVLVGIGPESPRLRALTAELGIGSHVVFRGSLDNPFPQMAASSVLVQSSEEEGFGLALVEAMTLGVPVISTDCPGGPREILADGRAGLLVPPGDERALARAMRRLVTDLPRRDELAVAAARRAADFAPVAIGRAWLDVFAELGCSGVVSSAPNDRG